MFSSSFGGANASSAGAVTGQTILLPPTTTWEVPAGVNSISVVCVQTGNNAGTGGPDNPSSVARGGTILCRAQNTARIGDGGGDGGYCHTGTYYPYNAWAIVDDEYVEYGTWTSINSGGGGAGGYNGNGGNGGQFYGPAATAAAAGSGGGGGASPSHPEYYNAGTNGGIQSSSVRWGGGVGLYGIGTTGAMNKGGSGGQDTTTAATLYGGGSGNYDNYMLYAGALSYKNNIPVTPGETLTIAVHGNGAIRIIWPGTTRAFPSTNTGDM